MVAGREVTPQDRAATERLMLYWTKGPGAVKIQWGVDGDFDRCVAELGKYVSPGIVKGLCSNLHQRATGARPGHAPGESGGDGHGTGRFTSGSDRAKAAGSTGGSNSSRAGVPNK